MMMRETEIGGQWGPGTDPRFTTTHWSVVLAAGKSTGEERTIALETLCKTYWRPLYFYVRRRGYSPEDAQDLTQEFFRSLLEKKLVGRADRTRGRFRTFLLSSLQNFLAKEWRKANTAKRGGGRQIFASDAESAEKHYEGNGFEELTPERAYEKSWAVATLEEAIAELQEEYQRSGKAELLNKLRLLLWDDPTNTTYGELGQQLNMSEAAVKMAVLRLRQRARELLRNVIANTVASSSEVEEEVRHLMSIFRN